MVFACVAGDLEFPSNADGAVESLALLDAVVYLPIVVFEIKGIIVETAKAHLDMELP